MHRPPGSPRERAWVSSAINLERRLRRHRRAPSLGAIYATEGEGSLRVDLSFINDGKGLANRHDGDATLRAPARFALLWADTLIATPTPGSSSRIKRERNLRVVMWRGWLRPYLHRWQWTQTLTRCCGPIRDMPIDHALLVMHHVLGQRPADSHADRAVDLPAHCIGLINRPISAA